MTAAEKVEIEELRQAVDGQRETLTQLKIELISEVRLLREQVGSLLSGNCAQCVRESSRISALEKQEAARGDCAAQDSRIDTLARHVWAIWAAILGFAVYIGQTLIAHLTSQGGKP